MKKTNSTSEDLYVVGIGASAGGLDALQRLFKSIPADTGMAFVVIQHLSPEFVSMMPELLSKHASMPIYTAEDKMTIKPNCVYLNRRNKNLHIKGHQLYLLDKGPAHNLNLPIDIFFNTLGEEFKEKSIGIILSGTGSDGSRGIKTIKGSGGIIMVQTPESAQFDGMPNSAIATNTVDFLLPPEDMGDILAKIPREKLVFEQQTDNADSNDVILKHILNEIHNYSGIDFSNYKPSTIQRRLANRLKILNFDTLKEYWDFLRVNSNEKELLKKDFLIGVSQFFRDPQAFETIQNTVLPVICQGKKATDTIRIWSAGCSTGEEAYSLAILFDEYIRRQKLNVDFKIFATDVESTHIQIAAEGTYYINSISEIEKRHLEQYFIKSGNKIQIIRRIREKIVFSKHNLLTDPPFIKMDFIACRNLLIYMNNKLQEKILQTFLFSLNKSGYLFLGNSETIPESLKRAFLPVDVKWKIFQSTIAGKYVVPTHKKDYSAYKTNQTYSHKPTPYFENRFKDKLESRIHKYLSQTYSPDAVIIDSNYEILFLSGNAGDLLSLQAGVFQTNLLDKLNPGLATIIRNAVQKLQKKGKDITIKNSIVKKHDAVFSYDITLHKISDITELNGAYLIQFSAPRKLTGEEVEITQYKPDELTQLQLKELEDELHYTKTELQNTLEELETSNEELQASNEELMASNEELQSTNEELQSVNEELYTVNTELQEKNTELQQVNDEFKNLINNTDIAVLYLDKHLNIRKFTPSIQALFDLHENDMGRPITHFASGFEEKDRLSIIEDAQKVIKTATPLQKEVRSKQDRFYLKRIHPFLTANKEVVGATVSFVDITKLKESEQELIAAKHKAEESERLKTAFLANMSHEIRTPMNGILGFLELMKEPDLDEESRQNFVEIVSKSAHRLLHIIDSILEISKIEAGSIKLHYAEFNLSKLLFELHELLLPKARNKGLEFRLKIPDKDLIIRSDRLKMESILSNLISNAIKYTETGFIEISAELQPDNLVIAVKDSGRGIHQAEQNKIFDRFYRVENNSTPYVEGNGLGLSIVSSYTEMLGGSILLKSAPGAGSTFSIIFNKKIIIPKTINKEETNEPISVPLNSDSNYTILIAEDDESNYQYLVQVLKPHANIKTIHVRTGKEAIEICRKKNIDLVLMDIKMPVIGGLEATKEILKIKPDLPIIAQTAYAFYNDRERALESGCMDYLSKPISPKKLIETVSKYLA